MFKSFCTLKALKSQFARSTAILLSAVMLCIMFPAANISAAVSDIIIDNGTAGYSDDGSWVTSTGTAGYYGTNYKSDNTSGADSSKWAKWTPTVTTPGKYDIYVRWTANTNRPNAAPLEIKYSGGTDTSKTVNQQANNGTWVLVGNYLLCEGTTNYVKLLCTDNGYTIADAVKFVYTASAGTYAHPGIYESMGDLQKIKSEVNANTQPRKSGWDKMLSTADMNGNVYASLSYTSHAVPVIQADGNTSGGFTSDGIAVYTHALQWYVTQDSRYADKAIEILNSYANTTTGIQPATGEYYDQHRLVSAWAVQSFCAGAEIIKYTYTGWLQADQNKFKTMMDTVFYPLIKDGSTHNGNWEASMTQSVLALAVFEDDSTKFNQGITLYNHILPLYIINSKGVCQETNRDSGHPQMGIGALALAAEIGQKQGQDLYGALSNRLKAGVEYMSGLLQGAYLTDPTPASTLGGTAAHPGGLDYSAAGVHAMYEVPYNHYYNRKGLTMTYTNQVIQRSRPHGSIKGGIYNWETLTHAVLN